MSPQFILLIICLLSLIIADIYIISLLSKEINEKTSFNYYDRSTWLLIIIWGSLIGQFLYYILEKNGNHYLL